MRRSSAANGLRRGWHYQSRRDESRPMTLRAAASAARRLHFEPEDKLGRAVDERQEGTRLRCTGASRPPTGESGERNATKSPPGARRLVTQSLERIVAAFTRRGSRRGKPRGTARCFTGAVRQLHTRLGDGREVGGRRRANLPNPTPSDAAVSDSPPSPDTSRASHRSATGRQLLAGGPLVFSSSEDSSSQKMARDGIEPPTRGFSVRCSTN